MMRTFELDESYFGAKRVRGKRGRGAAGKKMSFWTIKKRRKSIYSSLSQIVQKKL